MSVEFKTIGELPAAAAIDGTELLEVEQAGAGAKITGDIPRIDDLVAETTLVGSDLLRVSRGALNHYKITLDDFLVTLGITSFSAAIDVSVANYTQVSVAKKQIYAMTTGAGSKDFDMLPLADLEGCSIYIYKYDTGAGVCTVDPNGAETFHGGGTGFPLRMQGDFIELEIVNGVIKIVDSRSTLDSAALAITTVQTLAHSLGVRPNIVQFSLLCISIDAEYAVDDEIFIWQIDYSAGRGLTVMADATNFKVLTDAILTVMQKTTRTNTLVTMNKWKIRIRYKVV
jgi:hypothetical protein